MERSFLEIIGLKIINHSEEIARAYAETLNPGTDHESRNEVALRNSRLELLHFIGDALRKDDLKTYKLLIYEWGVVAAEVSFIQGRTLDKVLSRINCFRNLIIDLIEQTYHETIPDHEIFKSIRLINELLDHATYSFSVSYTKNYTNVIKEANETIEQDKKHIEELLVPIIPSIIPNVILTPLVGDVSKERMEKIIVKILSSCSDYNADSVVFDLTGVSEVKIENIGEVANEIERMTGALALIGVEVVYVGLPIGLVSDMVAMGVQIKAQTFKTFKAALHYIASKKGIEVIGKQ